MTNKELLAALLKKLGVTSQRLSQLRNELKDRLPMSTELATYVIAHNAGIDISKYLTADEVEEVSQKVTQLHAVAKPAAAKPATAARKQSVRKIVEVRVGGTGVDALPGMSATHVNEAKTMADVYPMLYVFENSARDVITKVLKSALGADWWEQVATSALKRKFADRKAGEDKNPWHGKRNVAEIYYVDLSDLPTLVNSNAGWVHFEPLFVRQSWFSELINDMGVSRNLIAHMNPLARDDVKNVEAAYRKWTKQLNEKKDLIPQ